MPRELDHLVIAARDLDEGSAWVAQRLGAAPVPGGKHDTMGTHNRILSLGPGRFLEVISVDPAAPAPGRPRWFDMDAPALRERLARGPALIHWVERTASLEAELEAYPPGFEIIAFGRGNYRWRMALRPDGARPAGGTLPTLIQWEGAHPADSLPESGVRLERFTHEKGALDALFSTPGGERRISDRE